MRLLKMPLKLNIFVGEDSLKVKLFIYLLVGLFLVNFLGGAALATGKDELTIKQKQLQEQRLELLRESPVNGPRTLAEEIDFWSEFLSRMAKTANAIVVMDNFRTGKLGLELSFYEGEKFDIIFGFIPDDGVFYGVESKDLPLTGNLPEIFKRLSAAIVVHERKVKIGLSYEWRS